jgi:hypothetical protein
MDFSPSYAASPRVEDEVNLCFLTDILLFPTLFFFTHLFFDTVIPLYYLHLKIEKYTLGLAAPEAH